MRERGLVIGQRQEAEMAIVVAAHVQHAIGNGVARGVITLAKRLEIAGEIRCNGIRVVRLLPVTLANDPCLSALLDGVEDHRSIIVGDNFQGRELVLRQVRSRDTG